MKRLFTTLGMFAALLLAGVAVTEPHGKRGNEVLVETDFKVLAGKRLGLITNPSAINYYALVALQRVAGYDLFAEAVKAKKKFDMFDKVNGTDAMRRALQDGKSAMEIVVPWRVGKEKFRAGRKKFLRY